MRQLHRCHPLDCCQLPINNKYTDGAIIDHSGATIVYTPTSHAEIRSHIKILFHKDLKTQRIKTRFSKEIAGFVGFRRDHANLGVPPHEEIIRYLETVTVFRDTFSAPATFFNLVDRIHATISQIHAKLPLRRDYQPGAKSTSWKHALTFAEQTIVNNPCTSNLLPVRVKR